MSLKAVIIGNSDGIGLATTRLLLKNSHEVVGISRSPSTLDHPSYSHCVADLQSRAYEPALASILKSKGPVDVCIFCAGIGEFLDTGRMEKEIDVFDVNLMGLIRTIALVIPEMVAEGRGHFIGLSSVADEMISAEAPSYHASKAAFSNYLEGLALALKPRGVCITNVRFGFVDTKMAKGDQKPFMITVDRAARHLFKCIEKKPWRYTAPKYVIPLVRLRRWTLQLYLLFGRG